jgi:hypothetical protein
LARELAANAPAAEARCKLHLTLRQEDATMNPAVLVRTLAVLIVSLTLAFSPQFGFAQRGGGFHGGGSGGGFHGGGFHGGGFSGFHGGGGFGGFRGGNFGGFRGGFGGFRNGFHGFGGFNRGWWGYPGWGWGWGVDVAFGFPYWGWGYPYWYGYGPWWGPYAYSYPYDGPYDDPEYRDCCDDRRAPDYRQNPDYRHGNRPPNSNNQAGPPQPSSAPNYFDQNAPRSNVVDYRTAPTPIEPSEKPRPASVSTQLRFASLSTRLSSGAMRPEVRNAIQLLQAMPPGARQRRLESGRYASFSPEEQSLLSKAALNSVEQVQ